MSYKPKEGVDYIVDLYAVAYATREANPDELRQALNQRMIEYHPDRLEGLAPEFRAKGEQMARLLNRARAILLDPEKRQVYDEVLTEWDGPVSADGTPVIRADRYLQAEMREKSPEEIEEVFAEQAKQVEGMSGYSPSHLSFLEKMVTLAGDDVPDDLRAEYEDALLRYDRTLAIQEAERSRLLSLPDIGEAGYRAGLDYSEAIAGEIEAAREVRTEELRMLAIGSVSTRLALLSGEEPPQVSGAIVATNTTFELPAYFDQQAEKVYELAKKREEIVGKRLANFRPAYPEADTQIEPQPNLAIGVGSDSYTWFGVTFDPDNNAANLVPLPEELLELLEAQDYVAVIGSGYNVLTFVPLEQVDIQTQLIDALEKHADKYAIIAKDE